MAKALFIAEKPSVAQEFAKALHENMTRADGYLESEHAVVSWCVGHLVTMSYPEAYDPALKKWSMDTLPFIPESFKYELIPEVKRQFDVVSSLLHREDVSTVYVCTDSGREGEYIYRLVEQMAGIAPEKKRLRVWIDSQTEEEIRRGIKEAKDLSAYDDLAAAAYLRAKEDYLMGINFSRVLSLKYGYNLRNFLGDKSTKIAVGRVMTCVQGMVVRREREIRDFVKTPFYRLQGDFAAGEGEAQKTLSLEWRAVEGTPYFGSPLLYKENGFKKREDAEALRNRLQNEAAGTVVKLSSRSEKTNPPLLFNLAELQNTCSKTLKISPAETLQLTQELYEKKLVTYPRTDARVLSTAVAKEIDKNIRGLARIGDVAGFAGEILEKGLYKGIGKSRYTNDKQITDHYAIIPTGQGLQNLSRLSAQARSVYEKIVRRFLAIFYPPAVYARTELELRLGEEHFFAGFRSLKEEGFMAVSGVYSSKARDEGEEEQDGNGLGEVLAALKKGARLPLQKLDIKEGETSPPKRYNSGSLILAMENAGQFIEDEDLRAQIKGSGIGTSATRAEILKKLEKNAYLAINAKTQAVTPTLLGELLYDTVEQSIKPLLNPELTASWELGLTRVESGSLSAEDYMEKLSDFVRRRVERVAGASSGTPQLAEAYRRIAAVYGK